MLKLALLTCVLCVTSFAIPERLPPLWSTWTPGSTAAEAVRVRAFRDDTRLRLDLAVGKSPSRVDVKIEGPLANFGDADTVGAAAKTVATWSGDRNRSVQLALPKAGLYRFVLVPANPSIDFRFALVAGPGATRPSLPLDRFLLQIPDAKIEAFLESLRPWLEALGQEPTWVARQTAFLKHSIENRNYNGLDRFPTLPSPAVISAGLQKLRAQLPTQSVVFNDRVFQGERLADLLAKATPDRTGVPPRAHAKLPPEIGYGHYPDQRVPAKFAAHSPVLAEVLTSLAARKGTVALPNGVAATPRHVFESLIGSGHRILVLEEKTLANFLSLTYRGQPVQWTTWMNTGVRLSSGLPVTIPSSHSQTTFEISGPEVNARVSFFLGMFGVGFFAAIDERPEWTGFARHPLADSTSDRTAVLRAVDLATSYQQMIREEQSTVAAGLPGGGYGLLGVCNDRSLIELALRGYVTTWPLLRPRTLTPPAATDADLAGLLSRMPSDSTPALAPALYRANAIHRLREAVPANSTLYRDDARFRGLMDEVQKEPVGPAPWR